jgi:hypothetical protein
LTSFLNGGGGKSVIRCREVKDDAEADLRLEDIFREMSELAASGGQLATLGPETAETRPRAMAMAPTSKARGRQPISVAVDEEDDSDQLADAPDDEDQGSELFLDPLHGNALVFYVHDDVQDRADILKLIRVRGLSRTPLSPTGLTTT